MASSFSGAHVLAAVAGDGTVALVYCNHFASGEARRSEGKLQGLTMCCFPKQPFSPVVAGAHARVPAALAPALVRVRTRTRNHGLRALPHPHYFS